MNQYKPEVVGTFGLHVCDEGEFFKSEGIEQKEGLEVRPEASVTERTPTWRYPLTWM